MRQQIWHDFEHIIIDGDFGDHTLRLLEGHTYPQLKFISQKDDGIYDAMNKAIQLAKGKYLLFLNAGDHLYNSKALEFVWKPSL